jgi:hypothetical protein
MNPNTVVAILTGALVLVTAYYAWSIRAALGTMQEMVAATKEMVETASRTYTLSLAPQVECRTVTRESTPELTPDAPAGALVSETTVTNVGSHRVRLSRVRLETDSGGEQVRRFVTRWLEPREHETIRIPFDRSSRTKVIVHLVDLAGQDHVVTSENA